MTSWIIAVTSDRRIGITIPIRVFPVGARSCRTSEPHQHHRLAGLHRDRCGPPLALLEAGTSAGETATSLTGSNLASPRPPPHLMDRAYPSAAVRGTSSTGVPAVELQEASPVAGDMFAGPAGLAERSAPLRPKHVACLCQALLAAMPRKGLTAAGGGRAVGGTTDPRWRGSPLYDLRVDDHVDPLPARAPAEVGRQRWYISAAACRAGRTLRAHREERAG